MSAEHSALSAGRAAATSAVVVAGLFSLVVGALLAFNQARLAENDPLNAPVLTELRRQYAGSRDDEALKARIRQEDLRARQGYFAYQGRAGTGAWLLLGGVLTLVAGLSALSLFKVSPPDVARLGPAPSEWDRRRAARRGLAAGALLLLAAAALAAGLARRDFTDPARERISPSEPRSSNPEPGTR